MRHSLKCIHFGLGDIHDSAQDLFLSLCLGINHGHAQVATSNAGDLPGAAIKQNKCLNFVLTISYSPPQYFICYNKYILGRMAVLCSKIKLDMILI